MTKPRIKEAIIVEGRYDKNTLSQAVDAVIIETRGFGVFSDRELLGLIRKMADARGIIILTDPDGAGFVIRGYLKGAVEPEKMKHAYIPDTRGREKRKNSPSKEGKLGVEGMSREVLIQALKNGGATFLEEAPGPDSAGAKITKADMYAAGLSGTPGSGEKRELVKKELGLPERLPPNSLLDVLNALMSREAFFERFGG